MTRRAVVIAGAGPTGLMLAAELALAGVDVLIVERRASQQVDGSRAGGLHSRTIEVLDQCGIADRFLAAGLAMQIQSGRTDMPPGWETPPTQNSPTRRGDAATRGPVALTSRPGGVSHLCDRLGVL